ncbi:MAG: peptidylprolyl isomerase [Pseudomonadales bacterium]
MLVRFFKKPSLHFVLLGILLFAADRWYNQAEDIRVVAYPDNLEIAELSKQWLMTTGRKPGQADLQRMVRYELDQRILLQEALRLNVHYYDTVVRQRLLRDMRFMGDSEGQTDEQLLEQAYAMELHVNDTVVKRRMMQAMESLFRSPGERVQPNAEQLAAIYAERIEEFTLPETRKVSHVFVSRDRHAEQTEQRARRLFNSFSKDNVDLLTGRTSTDPFLSGLDFSHLSQRQLSRHFGDLFSAKVFQCEYPGWCGPIESPYGWHLVWTHETQDARPQSQAAVDKKLRYYFKREEGDKALEAKMNSLRDLYEVQGDTRESATIDEGDELNEGAES